MPLRIGASVESTECHQCLGYDSVATPQPLLPAGMDLQHLIKMSAELFFFGVLGVGAAAFYNFPPKQRVLGFLVETIDWYRLLSVEQQIATEPTDMLFFEDNRPIGVEVVRFSFDFRQCRGGVLRGQNIASGGAKGSTQSRVVGKRLPAPGRDGIQIKC